MENAIVYGNGLSRLDFTLPKSPIIFRTYGCNGIYKEFSVNDLVVVDCVEQHEVYESGYAIDNRCWFTDWHKIPGYDCENIKQFTDDIIESKNGPTANCIVNGVGSTMYITWVEDKDKVVETPQLNFSAGTLALYLAANHGHKRVFMTGFDMDNSGVYKHRYAGYRSMPEWYDEHEKVYSEFSNVDFYRVSCKMERSECSNVHYIHHREFHEMFE